MIMQVTYVQISNNIKSPGKYNNHYSLLFYVIKYVYGKFSHTERSVQFVSRYLYNIKTYVFRHQC